MGKQSVIDKRIAELESEIAIRQHAISVLRSVQNKKVAKAQKPSALPMPSRETA